MTTETTTFLDNVFSIGCLKVIRRIYQKSIFTFSEFSLLHSESLMFQKKNINGEFDFRKLKLLQSMICQFCNIV
jgi:hypothetical protein